MCEANLSPTSYLTCKPVRLSLSLFKSVIPAASWFSSQSLFNLLSNLASRKTRFSDSVWIKLQASNCCMTDHRELLLGLILAKKFSKIYATIRVSVQLGLLCTETCKSGFALSYICYLNRNLAYCCDSKVSC